MKRLTLCEIVFGILLLNLSLAMPARGDALQAWGSDYSGQVTQAPAGARYVAIAAGDAHGLALASDGTVVAWGQNDDGECNVPAGTYKAVGAGADFSLAIRSDDSLAAWGNDRHRQITDVPAGSDFVSVDGGEFFAVALRSDGSISAWGNDTYGQVSGRPRGTGFTAVVAGDAHAVAIRSDGALVSWGHEAAIAGTPTSGTFTAIGAGGTWCVAVRRDGTLVWWGDDFYGYGLADVPAGIDYVAVAAGYLHAVALKSDGSLVGWGAGTDTSGHPNWGQADPPAGTDYTAIACGLYFSLGMTGAGAKPVISDSFDDNRQGNLWDLRAEDPANCWLEETNYRLELRATAKAEAVSAFYLADGWRIDPRDDFSLCVDFHCSLVAGGDAWVSLLLTTDPNDPRAQYVEFGAGASDRYPYFWYDAVDGGKETSQFNRRIQDSGMLYVSYDAERNELYLSDVGYGAKDAWAVLSLPWLVGEQAQGLVVGLGGGSIFQVINSGDAYLDRFALDEGVLLTSDLSPVYRFWSASATAHFYTISVSEKDKLIDKYPQVWAFEGPVYKVASTAFSADLAPVYRFWCQKAQTHFYTINKAEKDKLVTKLADVYHFEGVAFYAYPEGRQPSGSKPVYRFWAPAGNRHFYTISESEKQKLIDKLADIYTFEGVAFYAYDL